MGFPIKYETEEERLAAIRPSKNNYSNKPFTCSHCSVTFLLGNKHKHKKYEETSKKCSSTGVNEWKRTHFSHFTSFEGGYCGVLVIFELVINVVKG